MRELSDFFKDIRATAGGNSAEQPVMDVQNPVGKKPEWKREEILDALERGASGEAVTLLLQAVSRLADDPEFGHRAADLVKPTDPGEAWKRAYRTYKRYAERVTEAARQGDIDAACALFSAAAREVGEIYPTAPPFSEDYDPMSEQLALGVYSALSQLYDAHAAT